MLMKYWNKVSDEHAKSKIITNIIIFLIFKFQLFFLICFLNIKKKLTDIHHIYKVNHTKREIFI